MAVLGVFPPAIHLVEVSTKPPSVLEIALSKEEAEAFEHSQSYTRTDRVQKLEEAIRAEIFYRRGLSEKNKSLVHLRFADGLRKILDEHGVGGDRG
ncbi:MAG TPA: hypothetical protein VMS11_03385 [Solirubrobacterales bacterium]|nr:hypothetical protein [Solirubrobacterales bacterium]